MSPARGIRGAVQAPADTPAEIDASTRVLLVEMSERNGIDPGDVVAIWVTQTPDLTAAHAAASARALGWTHVPLLGGLVAAVVGELPRGVRALMVAVLDGEPKSVRDVELGATRERREVLYETGAGE